MGSKDKRQRREKGIVQMVVVGAVGFDLISVRKKRDNMRKLGHERGEWKVSKRGNGDLHARMVEVVAQAHLVWSKKF